MRRLLVCSTAFAISLVITQTASAATVYAVTTDNTLLRFSSSSPATIEGTATISGLEPGDQIVGIDIRPFNQALYGFGSSGRIYVIDKSTAMATSISSLISPTPGTLFGVDWEPATDSLRVVSDADANRRYASNGASVVVGPDVAYAVGDTNAGANPAVSGIAYAGPTLYDIDTRTDSLVTQDTDGGKLHTVGALGVAAAAPVGFDVVASLPGALAYAALIVGGFEPGGPQQTGSDLYTVDLSSGDATFIDQIGPGYEIRGLAVESTSAAIMRSFGASASPHGVVLRWRTASEVGLLGFRPHRVVRGARVPLTRGLIPASARHAGHSYRWVHRLAARTPAARYWLQAIHTDRSSTWYGPAALE